MDANDNHTSPPPSNERWQEEDEEDQPHSKRMKVRDAARWEEGDSAECQREVCES